MFKRLATAGLAAILAISSPSLHGCKSSAERINEDRIKKHISSSLVSNNEAWFNGTVTKEETFPAIIASNGQTCYPARYIVTINTDKHGMYVLEMRNSGEDLSIELLNQQVNVGSRVTFQGYKTIREMDGEDYFYNGPYSTAAWDLGLSEKQFLREEVFPDKRGQIRTNNLLIAR